MDNKRLAELLFPNITKTPDDYETLFPERNLPEGAQVTRLAPSPTGFIHLGNLYSALADERIAHTTGGVFFLRIEDTDAKRKVDGAVETIINVLRYFNVEFDQGAAVDTPESNIYGPYFQSERKDIYQAYVKDLVKKGLAYPCFCTEEDIESIKTAQAAANVLTGYHTTWRRCDKLTYEEIEAKIKAGMPYVMRLRSQGQEGREIKVTDQIMGQLTLPENIQDIVILKSDGIPTYHFAHAIDDHLMRTTLVIRGGEWISSLPTHYELFHVLGFKMPKYAHTAHMMKFDEETGGKRKLSKRKDPELSLDFYRRDGYHPRCMKIYLLTLLNSNFEEWYEKHPDADINSFPYSVKKMSNSGALFDIAKLDNICRNEFSRLDVDEVYDFLYNWVKEYQPEMLDVYFPDRDYVTRILELCMGVGGKRRRKDFSYAKQIFEYLHFFYDETFRSNNVFRFDAADVKAVLTRYMASYDPAVDNNGWFNNLKEIADATGFASDMKAYKANPENYKGSVSDVAEMLRIAITGSANSPDLWTIQQIIGKERTLKRIQDAIDAVNA